MKELHQQLDISTGQSSNLSEKLREEKERSSNYNQKMNNLHGDIDEMNKKMLEHH